MLKKFALSACMAFGLVAATGAQAAPVQTALSIVIDGSGSISSGDFEVQRDAYATVFADASVLKADGSVVINVVQFSSNAQIEQTAIRINNEADRATLIASINAMTQLNGSTAIGDGINLGRSDMDAFLAGLPAAEIATNFSKLIDVSTDAGNNAGASPVVATNDAVGGGYSAVNCLAVGAGNCSFMTGDGQVFSANSFADLQPVLENKVRTELGTIPVPATAALLGLGLIALGAVGRRRLAA
ncbi:hypothetical protein CKO28_20585 [Rhodovibrio sodomensis]|uniref:VWFA domain-containing protein n=1 Tax=Rhodovibrio sodomensis TaxID=1088 RepID=A0ABS1DIV7_9PROT|nr:DUF1194 domain-containing protein [Rhodovibrio sodomensis]MBK1670425.1 hypothetical protein [Rhodovibrio sodomensis]